jgi:transposase
VEEHGIPLSAVVTGANRHDVSQLKNVLEQKVISPNPDTIQENLCADAGYIGSEHEITIRTAGYKPHVRPRGEERMEKERDPSYKPRRWIVEVCHAWMNRFRKLSIRYEKLTSTYLALIHLASAIIALRKIGIIYG